MTLMSWNERHEIWRNLLKEWMDLSMDPWYFSYFLHDSFSHTPNWIWSELSTSPHPQSIPTEDIMETLTEILHTAGPTIISSHSISPQLITNPPPAFNSYLHNPPPPKSPWFSNTKQIKDWGSEFDYRGGFNTFWRALLGPLSVKREVDA